MLALGSAVWLLLRGPRHSCSGGGWGHRKGFLTHMSVQGPGRLNWGPPRASLPWGLSSIAAQRSQTDTRRTKLSFLATDCLWRALILRCGKWLLSHLEQAGRYFTVSFPMDQADGIIYLQMPPTSTESASDDASGGRGLLRAHEPTFHPTSKPTGSQSS